MNKIATFFILVSFAGSVSGANRFDTKTMAEKSLLRDGFVLDGTEGSLVGPDSNDVWFFELAADVNDSRIVVKSGTELQLLPSAALEQMITENRKDPNLTYQLWGARITKYKGRNFIFLGYFLPLKTAAKSSLSQEASDQVDDESRTQQTLEPELADSNSVLSIPPDILKKLKARRQKITESGQRVTMDEPRPSSLIPLAPGARPSVLVDRTGFVKHSRRAGNGGLVFVPDALGRNVDSDLGILRLLPCEILELAELKQAEQLEQVRLRIAAITTEYKGERYLLLQKATQCYNHGNFGW